MTRKIGSVQPVSLPLPELLTADQVAEKLGVGKTKLYELMKYKGLPCIRWGQVVKFNPDSVARWLATQEQAG